MKCKSVDVFAKALITRSELHKLVALKQIQTLNQKSDSCN